MGFVRPSPPPFDVEEWKAKPYLSRLKANVQDWAVRGFRPAGAVYLLYAVKLVVFTRRRVRADLDHAGDSRPGRDRGLVDRADRL